MCQWWIWCARLSTRIRCHRMILNDVKSFVVGPDEILFATRAGNFFPFWGAAAALVDLLLNKALESSTRALLIPFYIDNFLYNLDPIDEHIIRPFLCPIYGIIPAGKRVGAQMFPINTDLRIRSFHNSRNRDRIDRSMRV